MSNQNPAALITGASSRIGEVIARDLAEHSWPLILHAHRNSAKVQKMAGEFRAKGVPTEILIADLTDPDQLLSLMDKAVQNAHPPQVLINNASVFEDDGIGSLEIDRFDTHFHIHTRAPVFLADGLARALGGKTEGLIVNIIDQRVWKPTPQAISYTLSKTALWDATQRLAQALAPTMRVNAIGPGPSFKNERQSEAEFRRQSTGVLLERGPDPKEFGRTIRYLWETRSITGQMIALDGGQHLAWRTPDVTDVGE